MATWAYERLTPLIPGEALFVQTPSENGNVFYAVTTDDVDNPDLDEVALGVECAEAVWDAVLSIPGAVGGGERVVTPSW